MRIKKLRNGNEYLETQDQIWVRNFCNVRSPITPLSPLEDPQEYPLLMENELHNLRNGRVVDVSNESVSFPNIVIISDGFDFEERHKLLADLPSNVSIFATNKALAKWRLLERFSDKQRIVNYLITNNPYKEAVNQIPNAHRYFPRCIASYRTNSKFVERYEGDVFYYHPANSKSYSGPKKNSKYKIEDYRNPISASINLAFRFGVQKLLLFCCDNSFKEERPVAVKLENDLWTYPQHLISQRIFDAQLHWLKEAGVKVGNCSSGINLNNTQYIPPEQICAFFEEEDES